MRAWFQRQSKGVRYAVAGAGVLIVLVIIGAATSGSSDDEETTAGTTTTATTATPPPADEPPPTALRVVAIETLREEGRKAGAADGVSEDDLLPSEEGAELLIERGAIDEGAFCAAASEVLEAEMDPEAAVAFAEGWSESADGDIASLGDAIYQALSFRCITAGTTSTSPEQEEQSVGATLPGAADRARDEADRFASGELALDRAMGSRTAAVLYDRCQASGDPPPDAVCERADEELAELRAFCTDPQPPPSDVCARAEARP